MCFDVCAAPGISRRKSGHPAETLDGRVLAVEDLDSRIGMVEGVCTAGSATEARVRNFFDFVQRSENRVCVGVGPQNVARMACIVDCDRFIHRQRDLAETVEVSGHECHHIDGAVDVMTDLCAATG